MAAFARKNLMVDAEQLRRLAQQLGLNESETVRYAVDRLIHEDEVMTSVATIRRRGGLVDVFGRSALPDQARRVIA